MHSSASQNDAAYKRLFSHPRMVAGLVRLLHGPWIEDLDLNCLQRLPTEHIGDDLRRRLEDLPWWVPFQEDADYPPGAGVVFHFEFQSHVDQDMPERLLEYAMMLQRGLRRGGAGKPGRATPACVSVVVYNGRAPWTAARTVEAGVDWAPPELALWQPRFMYALLDAHDFAGDYALDGSIARAVLALDAASAKGLRAALARVLELLREAGDLALAQSFAVWWRGVLAPRFGDSLPSLESLMEEPTMLAETLIEWEELKISEGLERGLERGREEERQLLRLLASRRFGEDTAVALRPLLDSLLDAERLAEVGTLIVDCGTGAELLEGARRLGQAE